jgi:hypothetical protein
MILFIDPAFTRRVPLIVGEIDKRMQEIEITECEIGGGELVDLENLLSPYRKRTKSYIVNAAYKTKDRYS